MSTPLVEDESTKRRVRHLYPEIDSIDFVISEGTEIEVELGEPGCLRHIELDHLAQVALDRIRRRLPGFFSTPQPQCPE